MGFLVGDDTYERTYDDPDGSDEKLTVTLRPLNAGAAAAIEDTIAMEIGENEQPVASVRLGRLKLLHVQHAVVSWSLPVSPTAETIARLHPDVLNAIFADIRRGSVPAREPDAADPLDGGGS
jgi:hypothetical protein